jgi:hypothetical protein
MIVSVFSELTLIPMPRNTTSDNRKRPSLTSLALGLKEAEIVVPLWLELGDWKLVEQKVLEGNFFQKASTASTRRLFRDLRERLNHLSKDTLEQFQDLSTDDKKIVLFIAACKQYLPLFEFYQRVLLDKIMVFDYSLKTEDFDAFWNSVVLEMEELESVSEATRKKTRQLVFRILAEASIISSTRNPQITPLFLSEPIKEILSTEGESYYKALSLHS